MVSRTDQQHNNSGTLCILDEVANLTTAFFVATNGKLNSVLVQVEAEAAE